MKYTFNQLLKSSNVVNQPSVNQKHYWLIVPVTVDVKANSTTSYS